MKRLSLSLFALAAALPSSIHAQDFVLDEIVITATLTQILASRTGVTVDVLGAAVLNPSSASGLAGLLDQLPGVTTSSNGGFGTQASVRLRGLPPAYTAVRLDGIDISDPSGPQVSFDFGGLNRAALGRAEILRGAQSALYGSEAVGGLISLESFRVSEPGSSGKVEVEGGSFGTASAMIGAGVKSERVELSFGLSRLVTKGISAASSGTEKDPQHQSFATFYGAVQATDTLRIGLNGFWRKSASAFDGDDDFDGVPNDTADYQIGTLRGLRAFAELETGALKHAFSVSTVRTNRDTPTGYFLYFNGDRTTASYLMTYDTDAAVDVSLGADYTSEGFASGNAFAFDGGTARTRAVFAELRYAPTSDIDLSVAVRHDAPSDFAGKTTGRAALAWRVDGQTTLRAVAGTGFRTPSLYEQFSEYGRRAPGGLALTPESSRSLELGIERSFGTEGVIKATLFDTVISDKIDFDGASTACVSAFGCYVQTAGKTKSRGIELSGRMTLAEGYAIFGNYTYTDARVVSPAGAISAAARSPRHDLLIGLDAAFTPDLTGTISVQHVAGLYEAGTPLPDYTLVNASLGYAINDKTEAYLRFENLTNTRYETARGYNQPGRAVFAGLRARF